MKKMRPESTQSCSYCKDRAVWRSSSFSLPKMEYACDSHRLVLKLKEDAARETRRRDDDHMTEADYQTWGRL